MIRPQRKTSPARAVLLIHKGMSLLSLHALEHRLSDKNKNTARATMPIENPASSRRMFWRPRLVRCSVLYITLLLAH